MLLLLVNWRLLRRVRVAGLGRRLVRGFTHAVRKLRRRARRSVSALADQEGTWCERALALQKIALTDDLLRLGVSQYAAVHTKLHLRHSCQRTAHWPVLPINIV